MFQFPTKKAFLAYLIVSLRVTIVFIVTYGFTNWLASQHQHTYSFWMDWELGIPLVPSMIIVYFSLNLLMLMPIFTLQTEQIKALGKTMLTANLVAAVFFLIFPAPVGFIRTVNLGFWQPFYENLYSLDYTANTFPSLHIAFSYLMARSISSAKPKLSELFWFWFGAISFSVILTHQHHLIDIIGGIILAEVCFRKYYLKVQSEGPSGP